MLIIPPPTTVRRRRKMQAASEPVVPLAVIAVQDVEVVEGGLLLTAVFNTTATRPLADVSAAVPEKWSARYLDSHYAGAGLELLAYNRLRVSFVWSDMNPGDSELAYLADPSDISDATGQLLAAFVMAI